VGYLPAGTGAVATDVQSKMRESVSVKDFGAVGDGTTNDYAAIQAAIDATPVGGKLVFNGETYRIGQKLVVNKSINIDFANSTIQINNSSSPNNHVLDVYSLTETAINWTETIAKHQNTFTVTTDLIAGDYVVLELGTDPYDVNEEHYVRVCRVIANGGTTVTLDIHTPYAINGTDCALRKITSLVANCKFENLVMDYVTGTTPDSFIYPYRLFNVTFENIRSIKSRITINAFDCHNLIIRNVESTVDRGGVASHGRSLTMWQVENALIENMATSSSESANLIFIESWCRHIKFINLNLKTTVVSTNNLIQIAGGSYDISIDGLMADTAGAQPIVGSGVQPSVWSMDRLTMLLYPKSINLGSVRSFNDLEKSVNTLNSQSTVFSRLEISMQPSKADRGVFIARGIIKNAWVYVEDKTQLTNLYLFNSNNNGGSIVGSLENNKWVKVTGGLYGSDYPFNNPVYPAKKLSFYTAAGMVAGTKLRIVVEYWPIVGIDAYLFPVDQAVTL